jgi:Ca2+-transporting ATPase
MSDLDSKTKGLYFHTLTPSEVITALDTRTEGLSDEEVLERRSVYGKNELNEGKHKTLIGMFIEQFRDVMVLILLAAAAVSGFMHELTDTFIILAVVILNAVLGVIQESKAEKALEALKNMSKPYAKVKRNNTVIHIKSEEIVPGDIVVVEAGDFIPADIRLIQNASLKVEEAALTGESVPVEKFTERIDEQDVVLGDRKNMAYSGSSVSYGRGVGVVAATGMNTEVGKIAGYIAAEVDEQTPLQKKLSEMGKYLSIGVIVIAVIVFAAGMLQGRDFVEMFLTSVSLAVAAIPEGLPAIVTIVLAIGVQKMSKRNAIIRRLPAVETLGSTEIICSDKTGTLTQNKMTVKEIFSGLGFISPVKAAAEAGGLDIFMQVMTLCNDSRISYGEKGISLTGDPTETALVQFAYENGIDKNTLENTMPRRSEIPFDSDRKLMTTINQVNGTYRVLTKGAPDVLLERCTSVLDSGSIKPLNEALAEQIRNANRSMAGKALRVLALSYKDLDAPPSELNTQVIENNLTFIGLVGMIDPPREEVKEAVHLCKKAGIRPVMITGDHRDTAAAIARELKIIKDESEVITGSELDKIGDEDFNRDVVKYSVYARVSPEHKVRIVKAWKHNDKTVAMTGDGVNDAPALKASDIGVGMGITGTDVAKGVSDMVLADDNFATIVAAVREGRKIFSNIRKTIQFLLSANMGEVITLFVATMLNWSILSAIHILWINLVTDAFPALALGVEKAEKDIMEQKPRKTKNSIFAEGLGINVIYQGALEAAITLGVYYIGLRLYGDAAVTMAFVTLGLIQLTHSFNVRSNTKSLFSLGLFSNRYIVGAAAISAFLQLIVVVVPQLNAIFKVQQLTAVQWLISLLAAFLIIPVVEIVKLVQRKKVQKASTSLLH